MVKSVMMAAVLVLVAQPVWAVDLINHDNKKHNIKIKSSSSTTTTSIDSNVVRNDVCKECEIDIEGVGVVKGSGNQKIEIQKGGKVVVK